MSVALLHAMPPAVQGSGRSAGQRYLLQRTGRRPLRFEGIMLACAEDSAEPAWSAMRLALYRSAGGYVLEIRAQPGRPAAQARAWCHAAGLPSLEESLQELERIRPAAEASYPAEGDGKKLGSLTQAMAAQALEASQIHFLRHAVGRFLHRLCEEQTVAGADDCEGG